MRKAYFGIILCAMMFAAFFSGCNRLIQTEYYSITPHAEQEPAVDNTEAILVENFAELKNAILSFVENGVETGTVRIYKYASGDVEEDVAKATYEVSKKNPLGAYAVDYMTHECNLIVSYYEVKITTTFRRSVEEIRSIRQVGSKEELREVVASAMGSYKERVAVRISYYEDYDPVQMAQEYYERNPGVVVENPQVTVNLYPETGATKIMEISFQYQNSHQELLEKKTAILTNVAAAAQYVRYAGSEWEKMQLIYVYLQRRFSYEEGESINPVYSALCEGIAEEEGVARAIWLICGQSGITASVVKEEKDGSVHYGNLVVLDGIEYTVNVAHDIFNGSGLQLINNNPVEAPEPLDAEESSDPEANMSEGEAEEQDMQESESETEQDMEQPETLQPEEGETQVE